MTKVTLVTYDDEPPLGGQGVEVRGMRTALTARGCDVATVAGRGAHRVDFARVTGREPVDLSIHLNRHPRAVAETHPDVVHALGGPGGVLLLRQMGAPVVYTANHTYAMAHSRRSPKRLLSPLEARAYRRAAMVLAISSSTAAAVRALGVPSGRVEVLPPGVDVPDGPPRERDRATLLFAGRWEPHKGVLTALDVMRAVIRDRPGVTAVVAGGGSLESQVRRAALGEPAIDVAGRVAQARLAHEYATASVLLMPSAYEGLGLVALEAQAAGTVVVGYDVDGLRDAVAHRDLLTPAGDVAALQRRCVELLDDAPRRAELAATAQEWVRRTHSWPRVAERLLEIYAAVIAGPDKVAQ